MTLLMFLDKLRAALAIATWAPRARLDQKLYAAGAGYTQQSKTK